APFALLPGLCYKDFVLLFAWSDGCPTFPGATRSSGLEKAVNELANEYTNEPGATAGHSCIRSLIR
ncbi:MAG: hypothetical protein ACP5UM_14540, partial [Anaerolineae bacterium]